MGSRYANIACIAMLLACCARSAHSQPFQKALDTTTTSLGMLGGITSTTDGGYIMVLNTDSGDVQWKADATGQALWAKHYSVGSQNRARMPDGGIVFGELGTYQQGIGMGDYSYAHLKIVRTDASGDIEWSKLVTFQFVPPAEPPVHPIIATDASGNILFTTAFGGISGTVQWFVSLNASGALLWSRFYPLDMNTVKVSAIVSDGNANWFFAFDEAPDYSTFRMGHLIFLGSMQWLRSYSYTTSGAQVTVSGLTTVNSQPVVAGGLNADQGQQWFIMKANNDGSLAWYKAYNSLTPMYDPGIVHVASLPNGELIASGGQPVFVDVWQEDMIHTAADGSVLNSVQQDSVVDTQYSYAGRWGGWDMLDTTIALSSYRIRRDRVLGYHTFNPALWTRTPAELDGCLTSPVDFIATAALPGDVQTQTLTPLNDIPATLTIVDSAVIVIPVTLINTHDYCAFITAVSEIKDRSVGYHVINNTVEQGSAIISTSAVDGFLEALDVSGQQVASVHITAARMNELPTTDWRAGLYLLRATDVDGRLIGIAKVVVE